jgi:hypothetical protein
VIGLRVLSGFVGAAVLLLALILFVISGVMSPDSHDGCSAPAGDVQKWRPLNPGLASRFAS